jgi:hypothetical protein
MGYSGAWGKLVHEKNLGSWNSHGTFHLQVSMLSTHFQNILIVLKYNIYKKILKLKIDAAIY